MLIIRGKVRNKTLKKPIIYKIINEIKHKKNNDFIEKRATNSSIYKQKKEHS